LGDNEGAYRMNRGERVLKKGTDEIEREIREKEGGKIFVASTQKWPHCINALQIRVCMCVYVHISLSY